MNKLKSHCFFKGENSIAIGKIKEYDFPWLVVPKIKEIIEYIIPTLSKEYEEISEGVFVFRGANISKTACILKPCIICEGAEIRHGAFLRGNVIVGKGAVVGNSSEIKNSILFDGACVPHYNYVGDSIVGYRAHLGAGAIISNLKGDGSNVKIRYKEQVLDTGMRKLGAIIGDEAEVGCGCVLNPGTIIFSGARIYPLQSIRGSVDSGTIYKGEGNTVKRI